MAEKLYYKSFGRGGGLEKKTMSEVNFLNLGDTRKREQLALVTYENNCNTKLLKRKKQDVGIMLGQEKIGQQDCNKKVRKVRNENKMMDEQERDSNEYKLSQILEKISEKSDVNTPTSNDIDDNSSWSEYQDKSKKKCYSVEDAIKGFEKAFSVFYFLDNPKQTQRQASLGVEKLKSKYYEINKKTTSNELRGWSSRAMACALEIWHDEAQIELRDKYYKMDPCTIRVKLMKAIEWLNQQTRIEIIDTEMDITGFFHSGTENWEIYSYSKEQLAHILKQQIMNDNAREFFKGADENTLQNGIFAIRDLLLEQEFDDQGGNAMETPKFSYEVMIKKNVILRTSVTKNKYDPEDVFKLSSRSFINEIKKWPESALRSAIKNWRHSLKVRIPVSDIGNMSRTKLEYEVKKIRHKLIKYSHEDHKRRSPRKCSDGVKEVEIDFQSNHIELKEKRKANFHYYTQDEVIEEFDVETMRQLLHFMELEKAIKVDKLIPSIPDDKLVGYIFGAKDTLRELQSCYKDNVDMKDDSITTDVLLTQESPFKIKQEIVVDTKDLNRNEIEEDSIETQGKIVVTQINKESIEDANKSDIDNSVKIPCVLNPDGEVCQVQATHTINQTRAIEKQNQSEPMETDDEMNNSNKTVQNEKQYNIDQIIKEGEVQQEMEEQCQTENMESDDSGKFNREQNSTSRQHNTNEENSEVVCDDQTQVSGLTEFEPNVIQETPKQDGKKKVSFAKNIVSAEKNANNDNPVPVHPNDVKDFDNLSHSGSNLRGFDIGKFSPNKNQAQELHYVKSMERNVFFIRAKLAMSNNKVHAPSLIRKFFRVLRQADPSIQLLPFDEPNDDNLIITDDKHLPTDEEEIKRWAVGIHISQFNKLTFSLKVSNLISFKALKNIIFAWCTKNKCWVSFDHIQSEQVFSAGWIKGIHPQMYNRAKLKSFLINANKKLENKIHVYPRAIWQTNSDGKSRTLSEAIVIDGAYSEKNEILMELFKINWTGVYSRAAFIPFKLTSKFTPEHQSKAMQLHNDYRNSVYTKTIAVNDTSKILNSESGGETTMDKWLMAIKHNGTKLLDLAEVVSSKLIRIVYHKSKEHAVRTIKIYLFDTFSESFGKACAEEMLGAENGYKTTQKIFNMEETFSMNCAKKLDEAFVQERTQMQQRKGSIFYGNVVEDDTNNKVDVKKYADVISPLHVDGKGKQYRGVRLGGGLTKYISANPPAVVEMSQNEGNHFKKDKFLSEFHDEVSKLVEEKIKQNVHKLRSELDDTKKILDNTKKSLENDIEATGEKLKKLILDKEVQLMNKFQNLQSMIVTTQQEANEVAYERYENIIDEIKKSRNLKQKPLVWSNL